MAIRTRFSSLDMVRMAKFAKENPKLKPIPLIKAYCEKYPEISDEQKLANLRNWLHDNDIVRKAEASDECATLPIQHVSNSVQNKPDWCTKEGECTANFKCKDPEDDYCYFA